MVNKNLTDFKGFEGEIYKKNNFLLKTLKIKHIKKKYLESLKKNEINKYLVSKKKKTLTKKHIYKYVSQNILSSKSILFGIFFKTKHIGNCRIHFLKEELYIGIAIFDKSVHGQGFGTKSLKIVANFGFKNLNVNYIQARIHVDNEGSIRVFKKAGFKIKDKINNKYFLVIKKK